MYESLQYEMKKILEEALNRKLEQKIEQKLSPIYQRLDLLEKKVNSAMDKVDALDYRGNLIEYRVKQVEITEEIEIRPNVMFLTERCMKLRCLQRDILKVDTELMGLELRMNHLDSELRMMKELL